MGILAATSSLEAKYLLKLGVFGIFSGPVIPFQQVFGCLGRYLEVFAPAFPQVQLDTSAVPDTNCAQTGAIWLGSSAVPLISTAPLNARDARTKPSEESKESLTIEVVEMCSYIDLKIMKPGFFNCDSSIFQRVQYLQWSRGNGKQTFTWLVYSMRSPF